MRKRVTPDKPEREKRPHTMSYRELLYHSRDVNRKRMSAVWRITEIANRVWRVGLVKNTRNQAVRGYGWNGVWVMPERALPE